MCVQLPSYAHTIHRSFSFYCIFFAYLKAFFADGEFLRFFFLPHVDKLYTLYTNSAANFFGGVFADNKKPLRAALGRIDKLKN